MGPGETDGVRPHPVDMDSGNDGDTGPAEQSDVRVVNEIGLGYFRRKLVEHFDILWRQNRIKWPSRRNRQRRRNRQQPVVRDMNEGELRDVDGLLV